MEHAGVIESQIERRSEKNGDIVIHGEFPFNSQTVIDRGTDKLPPIKELFLPGAFDFSVNSDAENARIDALLGHDWGKPIASRMNNTLKLNSTPKALEFDAIIIPAMQRTSWVQDFLAGFEAGLIVGVSPGFSIPPVREGNDVKDPVIWDTEEWDPDANPPKLSARIRKIRQAILHELSFVHRPAYRETTVEMKRQEGLILPDQKLLKFRRRYPL